MLSFGFPGAAATASFVLDPAGANTPITPTCGTETLGLGAGNKGLSYTGSGSFGFGGQCIDDTAIGPPEASGSVQVALRFLGLPPGAHTIRMTKTDPTGTALFYAGWLTPATAKTPRVLICKDVDIGAAWAMYPPYNLGSVAAEALYHADADTVVAEFVGYPISAVDLSTGGWDPAVDVSAYDNIHPNNYGIEDLAVPVVIAALGLPPRTNTTSGVAPIVVPDVDGGTFAGVSSGAIDGGDL